MNARVEALVVGLGEHLSHQEKFDAAKTHILACLQEAEQQLKAPIQTCGTFNDVIERKDEHMVNEPTFYGLHFLKILCNSNALCFNENMFSS